MNSRLFADYARRRVWVLASLGTITAAGWFLAVTWSPALVRSAMATSILVASMFGLFSAKDLAPMEVQVLPICRREIARTIWFVSPLLPVGIMTTGKVLGWGLGLLSRPVQAGPETIWLSAAMDCMSAGTVLTSIALVQRISLSIKSPRLQMALSLGITLPALTLPYVPFVLRSQMPLTWHEMSWLTSVLLAVGAVCTAQAYLVPAPLLSANRHAIAAAMASQRRSGFWLRLDHLTGLRRLAFQVWRSAAISQALTPIFIAGLVYASSAVFDSSDNPWSGGWLAALRDFGFLPFEADWTHSKILMVFMLGSFAFRLEPGATGTGVLTSMRHLRTLPLSTRQLNLLLFGLSAMVWANGWLVLAGFHWLLSPEPIASLRLVELLALFGLDCLHKAAQLRRRTAGVVSIPFFIALSVVLMVATRLGFPTQPALIVLGLVSIAVAWFINQRTLTRHRKIYTPQKYRSFGVEIPGQS